MRNIVLSILLISNAVLGQTKKFVVTDTGSVSIHINREQIPADPQDKFDYDTVFRFNDKLIKQGGHFIAYYDKSYKQKAIEANFKDGKQIGFRTAWYRNGKLKERVKDTIFVKDFIFYEISKWYSSGEVKERSFFNGKDSTTYIYYYKNGNILRMQKEYYDTTLGHQLFCYDERHFENGQLCNTPLSEQWYKNRQQVTFYFPNGKTKISCTMFFVECIGKYQEWNSQGTLIISGQYEDYPSLDSEMLKAWRRPNKIGKWSYYNDSGQLTKEEIYNDKGELIETINK